MMPTLIQTQNIKMLTASIEALEITPNRRLLINIIMKNQQMHQQNELMIELTVTTQRNLKSLSMHSKEYHQKRSALSIMNNKFYISVSIVNANVFALSALSMVKQPLIQESTRIMMLKQSGRLNPSLRLKLINSFRHLTVMLKHY